MSFFPTLIALILIAAAIGLHSYGYSRVYDHYKNDKFKDAKPGVIDGALALTLILLVGGSLLFISGFLVRLFAGCPQCVARN